MLANGIKLEYGETSGSYTELSGLKEVPELGVEAATSAFRVLRKAMDDKKVLYFKQTYPDKTTVEFQGQVAVKLGGGGVNGVIEFTLKIALQSDLKFTDGSTSI